MRDYRKQTNGQSWKMYVWVSGKIKKEARFIEQSLICIYTIQSLSNARHEIAAKNIAGFTKEIKTTASLLKVPEENLEKLVKRLEWSDK